MSSIRRIALPLLAALALTGVALAVSACGYESHETEVAEGEPVKLGELSYNVIFSRFLNPNDNEDAAYLVGQEPPPEGSSYFGVFFEVQNKTEDTKELPDSFTVHDADKQKFESLPSESLFAFPFGGELESQEQIPILDSTAEQGAIEGSVVIFLLPAEVSENRPLTLEIESGGDAGEIELDL
jgi:hypothetical protein